MSKTLVEIKERMKKVEKEIKSILEDLVEYEKLLNETKFDIDIIAVKEKS